MQRLSTPVQLDTRFVLRPFVIYNRDMTAVVCLHSLDDIMISSVSDSGEGKRAALGISFRHRYTMMDSPTQGAKDKRGIPRRADEKAYPAEESFAVHPRRQRTSFFTGRNPTIRIQAGCSA